MKKPSRPSLKTRKPPAAPTLDQVAAAAKQECIRATDSGAFFVLMAYMEDGRVHVGRHRHGFPTQELDRFAGEIDKELQKAWLSAAPKSIHQV